MGERSPPLSKEEGTETVMVDIAMCTNESCPLRRHCYRQTATPGEVQSYSEFEFKADFDIVQCDYFMPVYNPNDDIV